MNIIKIKNKVRRISVSSFIRNVLTVVSGTILAQAITMLFSPFITRLYGPEAFGILGTFTSIVTITTTVAALTFPIAIVLPKKDIDTLGIIKLSFITAFFMSLMTFIFLEVFGKNVVNLLGVEILEPFLFLIPIIMFLTAGRQIFEQWLIRKKRFKIIAKILVYQSLVVNSAKLSGGIIHPTGVVLIGVAAVGYGLHTMFLLIGSRRTFLSSLTGLKEKSITIQETIAKYSDFPLYRGPQVFIAALTQSMPILMLTALFGPAAAGFYSIALTVLGLPSQLIGKAVGDVFYPRIAEASNRNEDITELLVKSTLLLTVIGIVPFGTIILFGPSIFSVVFGANWEVAGMYASWVAVWSYALFISNPSIKALPVIGAQKFYLMFTIINILFRGTALIVGGIFFKSDVVAVALFGITGAVLSVFLILLTIKKSRELYSN